jgi:hypothetical protein
MPSTSTAPRPNPNPNPPPSIAISTPANGTAIPAGAPLGVTGVLLDDTPPISVTLTNNNWQAGDPPQVQTVPAQFSAQPQWQTSQQLQVPNRQGVSLILAAAATIASCGGVAIMTGQGLSASSAAR